MNEKLLEEIVKVMMTVRGLENVVPEQLHKLIIETYVQNRRQLAQ